MCLRHRAGVIEPRVQQHVSAERAEGPGEREQRLRLRFEPAANVKSEVVLLELALMENSHEPTVPAIGFNLHRACCREKIRVVLERRDDWWSVLETGSF